MTAIRWIQLGFAVFIMMSMISLMIRRKSNESVSLIWILIAVLAGIQGVFPQLLDGICAAIGIENPAILVSIISIAGLIGITFYLSSEVAVSQNKIRELAMHISLLNKEVSELKKAINDIVPKEKQLDDHE